VGGSWKNITLAEKGLDGGAGWQMADTSWSPEDQNRLTLHATVAWGCTQDSREVRYIAYRRWGGRRCHDV